MTAPIVTTSESSKRPPWHVCVVHLRYCRLEANQDRCDVRFNGRHYTLSFKSDYFPAQKGYLVESADRRPVDVKLLLWLSVYIGEDAVDPFREIDTRFIGDRGSFRVDPATLAKFLQVAQRVESNKWPKWRRELFDNAIVYFSVGVRSGVNMMPLSLGFFALSLECLGNVSYGKRDKHWGIGERKFRNLMTTRLARMKRNESRKEDIRRFTTRLDADIDLLNELRNAFYGHSLLHLVADRKKVATKLRAWLVRYGAAKSLANLFVKTDRVAKDIHLQAHALFKLGLRINRLFIFYAMGFTTSIPFASHDWMLLSDVVAGEVSEFKGMRFSIE